MKTVMQVAIEHFKNINYDLVNVPIKNVPHILEQLLEKEKEQSIELIKQTAMFMAAAPLDEEIAKMSYEDVYNSYYNQTYNQNK